MLEDDLAAFFDVADFGVQCTRLRVATDPLVFGGILSTADEEAFDGHATAGRCTLGYATGSVDLIDGDQVHSGGVTYRVLHARRRLDGAESEALLSAVSGT